MDTAPILREVLKRDGIIVFLTPNYGLRTKGKLTDSLRENIRASKNELISYLVCQQKLLWQDSFQTLLTMAKPKFIQEERWKKIKTWASLLGDKNVPYIDQFVQYAWTLKDIFGCHAMNPEGGHLQKGFLMMVTSPHDDRSEGLTLHEVLENRIVFLRSEGHYRSYFKQSQEPVHQVTLLELS